MKFLVLFGILAFAVLAVSAQTNGNYLFNLAGVIRNLTKRVQTIQESVVKSTRNGIDDIQNLEIIDGLRKQISNLEERIQLAGKILEKATDNIRDSDWLQGQVKGAADNVRKAQKSLQKQVSETAENIRNLLGISNNKTETTEKEDSTSSSDSGASDSNSNDSEKSDSDSSSTDSP